MKNRLFFFCLLVAMAVSCVKDPQEIIQTMVDDQVFYAMTEETDGPRTKVYVDDMLRVLWNADDRVSIFNKTTYNRQYRFTGEDGDNAGSFARVPNDDFVTSNPLDFVYSVYPFNDNTKITNDGEITVYLPSEQSYRDNSFGLGANTMIAITDDNELMFKNLCGFFAVKLYGDNVAVKTISIKGNNNELLAGKATVSTSINAVPTLAFNSSEATEEIVLTLDTPVKIGLTAETATSFWFVIPPTTFEKGITLIVTDEKNRVFEKTTSTSLIIKRNSLKKSSSLEVIMNSSEIPVSEAIDLGLSVKWAPSNVGAEFEWEAGGRYAWGELEEKEHYDWDNYKWCAGSASSITKYCTSSSYGTIDGKTRLDPEDDVAHVQMGEEWRMPTSAEMTELMQNCTWTSTTSNGVSGYRVTGPNGNSIFIPISGQFDESGLTWRTSAFLWTADCDGVYNAYCMWNGNLSSNHRHDGLMVRGVSGVATQEETVTNLSENGTANCYIVSSPGKYQFRADVKGCSSESVGSPVSAHVLWESFGTEETPEVGELLNSVSLSNGFVFFDTPEKLKNGNAVIAIEDMAGTILWSWHIWICEGYNPEKTDQIYKKGAGTMMDRNLGSLSVSPGDVGCLGLLYQWGRKDPFLGAARTIYSSSSNQEKASSSVTWPSPVASSSNCGNESYTISHPMTFVTQNNSNYDWYYGTGGNRWTTGSSEKSIQDPCPVGYRVPDGGDNGIWETAGYTSSLDQSTMTMRAYILQSGQYATYPAAGFLMRESGALNYAGYNGLMWSATSSVSGMAYYMDYYLGSTTMQTFNAYKADARPVRCVKMDVSSTGESTHEYVDLGLSVNWASCNVGAIKPEDYGDYFAWGEIGPKKTYNWSTYKWCNGSGSTLTKYNRKSANGTVDNKTTLDLEDDAAYANWGDNWRMPTLPEMKELMNSCVAEWTTENGVIGCRFKSKQEGFTDKSVFFPAAGYRDGNSLSSVGSDGRYWTSYGHYDSPMGAHGLYLDSSDVYWGWGPYRYLGFCVRPVLITPVSSIRLSATSITLSKDSSQHLEATVLPEKASRKTLIWASSDESVVTVDEEGNLMALATGIATISVRSIDGSGVSATCVIKVSDPPLPESVDLGLSVKWATFNLGASSPEEYGDYYAWGEIDTIYEDGFAQTDSPVWKSDKETGYNWESYLWCSRWNDATASTLSKYNTLNTYGDVDNKTTLDLEDDAAHNIWGGKWRMPTQEEQAELRNPNNCSWEWVSYNGVNGYLIKSKRLGYEGKSIFLPAAGCRNYLSMTNLNLTGSYWSSSMNSSNPIKAFSSDFNSEKQYSYGSNRYSGQSIRPVCTE